MLTSHHIPLSEFIQPELLKALRLRQALPHLTLGTVPIDQNLSFELWTPKWTPQGSPCTQLEIDLLRRDRPRVTSVLSKLAWLMGAICVGEYDWDVGDRQPIHDWDAVVDFVHREGQCVNPIVTEVLFNPHKIIPIYNGSRKQVGKVLPEAWEISPPHWSIIFNDLVPVGEGFQLKQAKAVVSVNIWTGKPTRREIRSGKFYVEYHDLYAINRD